MTSVNLPIATPICLDAAVIDGHPDEKSMLKLSIVTNLLLGNCVRVRAATLFLNRANNLLPSAELAVEDEMAYADAVLESMEFAQPWRRMAARDAVFGAENFRFLLDLLVKRPNEFG